MLEGIFLPLALLILGAGAFFIEVFVPSGGLISVVGIACTVSAITLAFKHQGATAGMMMILAALVLIPTSFIMAFRLFPKTRMGKRLTLSNSQTQEEGFSSQDVHERDTLGKTGIALTNLRPAGSARIDGAKCDVMTEGEMIAKGAAVEVRRVEGNRIVVKELKK